MSDPLDPDRLDTIEGACESLPVLAMPKAEVLALVAAARELADLKAARMFDREGDLQAQLAALLVERDALRAERDHWREAIAYEAMVVEVQTDVKLAKCRRDVLDRTVERMRWLSVTGRWPLHYATHPQSLRVAFEKAIAVIERMDGGEQ